MATLRVVDISSYQKPSAINYDRLAKDVDGVVLRIGFTGWGTGQSYYKDDSFERHYEELSRRGVPIGVYWYSCADTVEEGRTEAKEVLKHLADRKLQFPIYMDIEDSYHQAKAPKSKLTDSIIAFLEVIEEADYFAGYYTYTYFTENIEMDRLSPYALWIADYRGYVGYKGNNYGMWQYTSTGRVDGYASGVDLNHCYVDYPTIIKASGLSRNGHPTGKKSLSTIVSEVLVGKWGNGDERKHNLTQSGYDYEQVQNLVNETLRDKQLKAIDEIAKEVIDGKWGNGKSRFERLNQAGYNAVIVQNKVNELLSSNIQTYTVQAGDNLSLIAHKFGTTINKVVKDNGIENANLIYPGQKLEIK